MESEGCEIICYTNVMWMSHGSLFSGSAIGLLTGKTKRIEGLDD